LVVAEPSQTVIQATSLVVEVIVKALGLAMLKFTTLVQPLKSVIVTLTGPAHKPEAEDAVDPLCDQR